MLTAAAAAVDASLSAGLKNASSSSTATVVRNRVDGGVGISDDAGKGVNVNCNTPLSKGGLLAALREVGVGVKAPLPSKRKGAKGGGGGRRKKEPLAGLLAAIEVSCALAILTIGACASCNTLFTYWFSNFPTAFPSKQLLLPHPRSQLVKVVEQVQVVHLVTEAGLLTKKKHSTQ